MGWAEPRLARQGYPAPKQQMGGGQGALGKGLRCEAPSAALRKLKRWRLGHFGYKTCKYTEASCTEELLLRKVRIQVKDWGCQTRAVRLETSGSPVTPQNQTEERTCWTLLLQQLKQPSWKLLTLPQFVPHLSGVSGVNSRGVRAPNKHSGFSASRAQQRELAVYLLAGILDFNFTKKPD